MLFLIRNGISENTAFALDDVTRAAFCIICAELDGQVFDRKKMRFKEAVK